MRTCVRWATPELRRADSGALASGDPLIAITTAAECERVVLDDALALAVLLLRAEDKRGSRAPARAAGRFALEQKGVDLQELSLIVGGSIGCAVPTSRPSPCG